MKIVIGVDGSDGSCAAAEVAGRILSPEKDELLLYYSPPRLEAAAGKRVDPQIVERLQRTLETSVFDKARGRLPVAMQACVREIVGAQKAGHGLLLAADEARADLIVVGLRGSGPLPELAIGSVAREIVHQATVPVLVVRPGSGPAVGRPMKVLLASDGSEPSRHACAFIRRLSWPPGTVGRIIAVAESTLAGQIPPWFEEQLCQQEIGIVDLGHFERTPEEQQRTLQDLVRWCGPLPEAFEGQEPIVAEGHASQEILKAIRAEGADLVVVGARGRASLGRILLGSTSEHLLNNAPCSVLVVRQHQKP